MKATIRKRGAVWYLDSQVEGVRHRAAIGEGSKAWAQARGNELLRGLLADGNGAAGPRSLSVALADLEGPWRQYATGQKLTSKHVHSAWRSLVRVVRDGSAKVEGDLRLSDLNPQTVEAYRERKLAAAEDEVEQDRHERSVCSTWTQARSVLQPRALDFYRRRLQMVLPKSLDEMRGFQLPRAPAWRYSLPPAELIERTEAEGAKLDGDLKWVFRLALNAGLRAGEIVALTPDWVEMHGEQAVIAVVTRADFRPKGTPRRIPIPASLGEDLLALPPGPVLSGRTKTEREDVIRYEFADWMRSVGWDRARYPKAAHELRKLFGSRVFSRLGSVYAQQYLGHASVETTCRYYAALDAPLLVLPER